MKKFLILAMVLVSYVSYGQSKTYDIYSTQNEDGKKINLRVSQITITSKTISLIKMGETEVFNVTSIKPYFDSFLYKVAPKNSADECEFFVDEKNYEIEYTEKINRLSGEGLISRTLYSYKKQINLIVNDAPKENVEDKLAIGTLGGFGLNFSNEVSTTYNYGAYFDLSTIGFEFGIGAGLTNNNTSAYLSGMSSKYIAGYSINNYGAFYNINKKNNGGYYVGGGLQTISEIATNNSKITNAPYGIVGLKGFYGDFYEIRGELNIGIVSSVSVGFGIRF